MILSIKKYKPVHLGTSSFRQVVIRVPPKVLEPATLATDLAKLGLCLQEELSPSDIQARYFEGRKDKYYACEHAHFAFAVVE